MRIGKEKKVTMLVMKNNPDFTEQLIRTLSQELEMSFEEVIKRMRRPWGVKQAVRGQLPDYRLKREQTNLEVRLNGGLGFM